MTTALLIFLAVVAVVGWVFFFVQRHRAEKHLLAAQAMGGVARGALDMATRANRSASRWMWLCVAYAVVLAWVAFLNPGLKLWLKK